MAEMSWPGLAFSPIQINYPLISIAEISRLHSKIADDFLPSKNWRELAKGMKMPPFM